MVVWGDQERFRNDSLVSAWLGGYRASSSRNYLWHLTLALGGSDSPGSLLRLNEDGELRQRVIDRARTFRDKGQSQTGARMLSSVASFCNYHGVDAKWRRGEMVKAIPVRVHYQHVPSRNEVYGMADVAGFRNRPVILCLFQSGVRVNCLSRWDMRLVGKVLESDCQIPFPLRITSEYDSKISAYGLSYYMTFLGAEAVKALRDLLVYRTSRGWKPRPESGVWGNSRYPMRECTVGTHQISAIVRSVAEKAGLPKGRVWTHTLRKSFQKALNASPGLDEDTKESLMGHILPGSRGNYFDYHDIDEIRDKYAKVPLSRESSTDMVGLREDVEKTRVENRELKAELALLIARSTQNVQDQERRDKEFEDLKKQVKDYQLLSENLMRDYGRVVETIAKKKRTSLNTLRSDGSVKSSDSNEYAET